MTKQPAHITAFKQRHIGNKPEAHVPDFIVRGLNADGQEFFYVRMPGNSGWISPNITDALRFDSLNYAHRTAVRLNARVTEHNVWFIAVPENYRDAIHVFGE